MRIELADGWYYDYDELSVKDVIVARTYWQLYFKGLELMPATMTDEQIYLQEMNELNAIASILKKDGKSNLQEARKFLEDYKGSKAQEQIEWVKQDFFSRPSILPIVSQAEFVNFTKLVKLLPERLQSKVYETMLGQLNQFTKSVDNFSSKTPQKKQ